MNVSQAYLYSFKIIRFFAPRLFKVMQMSPDVPMGTHHTCPADETVLKTMCTLVGREGTQKIRVGCCPMCGYVGYIDRPSPKWMEQYYLDHWDDAPAQNVEELIVQYRKAGGRQAGKLYELIKSIPADTTRPVLEIGCGYGKDLKGIEGLGFKKCVGIEHSTHRADVARRAFDLDILVGPFEHESVQAKLKTLAPFSIIFSNQVFEHVYDIANVIESCARLQNNGDHICIAMPNAMGEVSGITLLYIPHLHSMTPVSLENILGRYGYEIIDNSRTSPITNIVIAKKTGKRYPAKQMPAAFETMVSKFVRGLGFGKAYARSPRFVWCFRRMDYGGQEPVWSRWLFHVQWFFMTQWLWRRRYREELIAHAGQEEYQKHTAHVASIFGAAVEDGGQRFTRYEDSPLEIQFTGDISFLCK